MCAAQMPPLAHIFRGTFVHSTWTCPMEVLRDHLLGVSDSGKVSGRGVWRTSTGGRTGGRNLALCAAKSGVRSVPSRRRGSGVELECLVLGEPRQSPGAGFVGWTGSKEFPKLGAVEYSYLRLVRQPSRLRWKRSEAVPSRI
ncbi:hypothetical protein CB1_026915002 [Camelus ferus]|nr:hypothetical protein CB1_026915002 [Camelus ferus]